MMGTACIVVHVPQTTICRLWSVVCETYYLSNLLYYYYYYFLLFTIHSTILHSTITIACGPGFRAALAAGADLHGPALATGTTCRSRNTGRHRTARCL